MFEGRGERENIYREYLYLQLYFTSMDTRPSNWSKCQSFCHFCSLIYITTNKSIRRYLATYYILLMMPFGLSKGNKGNYDEILLGSKGT